MIRMISLTGFGGGFLMISPKLRALALDGFSTVSGDLVASAKAGARILWTLARVALE